MGELRISLTTQRNWNHEKDGGGAKLEGANNKAAYVGTHDDINGNLGAQIYADKNANESTIIDVTEEGAFYTKGVVVPGAQRDVEANEVKIKLSELEGLDDVEYARRLAEMHPLIKYHQALFYSTHRTPGRYYSISQFREFNDCAYETARTSMDALAKFGYYKKEQIKNKFVYTPIKIEGN